MIAFLLAGGSLAWFASMVEPWRARRGAAAPGAEVGPGQAAARGRGPQGARTAALTTDPCPPLDTVLTRMAVHDAGHTIAAWFCTAVRDVERVSIREAHGAALWCVLRDDAHPPALWCRLVVLLAGVAAEARVFRRWRSLPAHGDLAEARRIAATLAGQSPPWPAVVPLTLPFDAAFSEPLAAVELAVLHTGYAMARQILLVRHVQHRRLVGALLHREHLTQDEIADILGTRSFVRLIGLWGRCEFALPAEVPGP